MHISAAPPDQQTALFLEELRRSELQQIELSWLLGKHLSVVNRWCQFRRKDHVTPPRYALAFLLSWNALPARGREQILNRLEALERAQSAPEGVADAAA